MTSFADIVAWIQANNGKIGVVLGLLSTSGVWRWWIVYRSRIHAIVRRFGLGGINPRFIGFEVENVSDKTTSLQPSFSLVGYSAERKKQTYRFTIQDDKRLLEPHKPLGVSAAHSDPENRILLMLWYMKFKLPLTKGRPITLRFRNIEFKELGWFPFYWGLFLFRAFGYLPPRAPLSRDTQLAILAEIRAQETLIVGKPGHPDLKVQEHRAAVVQCKLVNESKVQRAQVTDVKALDIHAEELPIEWSDRIDELGMPTYCGNLISVDHEAMLYIRHLHQNAINYAHIIVTHNMARSPAMVTLDDWGFGADPKPLKD